MEKGVLLDCARKYYTPHFMIQLLDVMEEAKFNTLQLHFSDNEGYRIASERYPALVSEKHWTKEELLAIKKYAEVKKIQLIPELDSPGHLQHIITVYPEFSVTEQNVEELDAVGDITNPDFIKFITSLLEEILELFETSPVIHLGSDEVLGMDSWEKLPLVAKEKLSTEHQIAYINQLASIVEKNGKRARVWNDAYYQTPTIQHLKSTIEIAYWTRWHKNMAPIDTFIEHGHSLFNYNDNYLYFVLGEAAGYTYPTVEKIKSFSKDIFSQAQKVPEQTEVKGVYFSIWGDRPEALTEEQVLTEITPLLYALLDK